VTRKAEFGVLTLFVGDNKERHLRHGHVPAGIQVNFKLKRKPELEFVDYNVGDV
jgi:hypothetical protein